MKPLQAVSTLKAGQPRQPRRCLEQRAAIGEYEVGSRRAEDDQVDIRGAHSGRLEGTARGMFGKVDSGLSVGGDVPTLDAGASPDPLVGGIHHLFEIGVGENLLGKMTARAGDTRMNQVANLLLPCSACAICDVRSLRAATAAVPMALEKATPSARPWLFTTIPVESDHARAVVSARIETGGHPAKNRSRDEPGELVDARRR